MFSIILFVSIISKSEIPRFEDKPATTLKSLWSDQNYYGLSAVFLKVSRLRQVSSRYHELCKRGRTRTEVVNTRLKQKKKLAKYYLEFLSIWQGMHYRHSFFNLAGVLLCSIYRKRFLDCISKSFIKTGNGEMKLREEKNWARRLEMRGTSREGRKFRWTERRK